MLKKRNFLLLIGLGIVVIIFLFIPRYFLELRSINDNKLIFLEQIKPGDIFILEYIHSVSLTSVQEFFKIDEEYQIILIETDFLDHGAGLPYTNFGQEVFLKEEGKFKIKNMQRFIPVPLYYRVGESSHNCFYFRDNKIDLSSLLGDTLLTIKIVKQNNLNLLWGVE